MPRLKRTGLNNRLIVRKGVRRARVRGGRHVAADAQPRVCVREYQGLYWAQIKTGIQRGIHP